MATIDADLVEWTHNAGGVDIATIAKWYEQPKTEIAKCLALAEFLKVWDSELTPAERTELVPVLLRKKNDFLKRARGVLSPTELARDKTYRRLRSMFPDA
jgi:hypothetical protein